MSTTNQTEFQKMIAGQNYSPADRELSEKRSYARGVLKEIAGTSYDDWDSKRRIYDDFFGSAGADLFIEQPFICDYGCNIYFGKQVYVNFNCIFLDSAPIYIGDHVMIAPSVQIYTATHPLNHKRRNSGLEFAKPITIGDDVWLGGGAILNPGITIGDRSVVGSGSVVTRNIPSDVLVAGNPARVVKAIDK